MKILIFGATGQVAIELQKQKPKNTEMIVLARGDADLVEPNACREVIKVNTPDLVINAAAYTAVDKAEDEEELATVINGAAPSAMAQAAKELSIPFVHISSDYVFSGSGQVSWKPSDPTEPLGAYGRSKLVGEDGIREIGGKFVILRTSWIVSAHGTNFVKTMLRLGKERDELSIVADQIGGPTGAREIAKACLKVGLQLANGKGQSGTYHFSGTPNVSWADFARAIFSKAKIDCDVVNIPSSDFPTLAKRPLNSRLECGSLTEEFGITRPNWNRSLNHILEDLGEQ